MLFFQRLKQILFNRKIKSLKYIETELSLKTIAEIPFKKNKKVLELVGLETTQNKKFFKKLITNIQFLCVNKVIDKKVMLVTSPEKEVGKSYIVANMAVGFAEIGKKVLVIDADLTNGRQNKIFNVPNNLGLSNYLSNIDSNGVEINEFLSKYINETTIKNVNLITSGSIPPNPEELLGLPRFQELLKDAKVFYDIILIDATEAMEKREILSLTRKVNSTIIVVSKKKSRLNNLCDVKKEIQNARGNILGIIFNEVKIKKEKKTRRQLQEDFSKFKLKMKSIINETVEKVKKKIQDNNQKLLEEAKKEDNLKVDIVKEEKNELIKENKIVENKKNNRHWIDSLKNAIKKENKELDKENVDKNQLSIFDELDKVLKEKQNNKSVEIIEEKNINSKDVSIDKANSLKSTLVEKTKEVKEKSVEQYNKIKDFYINKYDNFKKKKNHTENVKNLDLSDENIEISKNNIEIENKTEINLETLNNDKIVWVVVDAENGCCRVFSREYFGEKLIRGFDKKSRYIMAHYSNKNLKMKQEYFIDKYQFTQSQAQKIDSLIFDALNDYDEYIWLERKMPSDKSERYALSISKEYEKASNESDEEFFVRSQRQRKKELEESNLEILYKMDNIWKTRKMNFFDKFALTKFAKLFEISESIKNDSEIRKTAKTKEFYNNIISGAEKKLEKAIEEYERIEETKKQVIEEDRKIKQEQLKLEQQELEIEKRAAQERIKLEQENVKAEKKAEAKKARRKRRREREAERIEKKEESIRKKREKQIQKEDAKYQKELEKVKQREEAKLEEELLVDNLYPKTKHNKSL